MHWSVNLPSLVLIMACRLVGAKPLSEPMLEYCYFSNWNLSNKLQWNFNQNSNIFIQESALKNVVCEMASNLSRPQCVKTFSMSKTVTKFCLFQPRSPCATCTGMSCFPIQSNPSGAEAGILWEDWVGNTAADALAPSITRPSAAWALIM